DERVDVRVDERRAETLEDALEPFGDPAGDEVRDGGESRRDWSAPQPEVGRQPDPDDHQALHPPVGEVLEAPVRRAPVRVLEGLDDGPVPAGDHALTIPAAGSR